MKILRNSLEAEPQQHLNAGGQSKEEGIQMERRGTEGQSPGRDRGPLEAEGAPSAAGTGAQRGAGPLAGARAGPGRSVSCPCPSWGAIRRQTREAVEEDGLQWAVGRENLSSVLPSEGLNPGQPQGLERNKQQPGAKATNSLKPGVEKTAHRSHLAGLGVGQSSGKQSRLVTEAMRLGGKDGRENANTVRKYVSNYKHGEERVAICGTEK